MKRITGKENGPNECWRIELRIQKNECDDPNECCHIESCIQKNECDDLMKELHYFTEFPFKILCKECGKYCNDCDKARNNLGLKRKGENLWV